MEQGREVCSVTSNKLKNPAANIFFLKSIKPQAQTLINIQAEFSSTINKSGKQFLILPSCIPSKTPLYNGFQVNWREDHSSQDLNIHKDLQAMIQKAEPRSSAEILAPKPKTSFCYLCKMSYSDYLKHLDLDIHKLNISRTQINVEIRTFVQTYLSSSARRTKLSDYEKEDMDIGHTQPAKRRITEETPSLLGGALSS